MNSSGVVVAELNRAGLGNYLFPWLRSAEISHLSGRALLPPQWFQWRLGPYVRREPDKREYWRLFPRPSGREVWTRRRALRASRNVAEPVNWREFEGPVLPVRGMRDFFNNFELEPSWHRDFISASVRPGVLSTEIGEPYLACHIRLGDFQPASDSARLDHNNTSSPLTWFTSNIDSIRQRVGDIPVVVCSDGSDDELASVLALPDTRRAPGLNALDDIMVLAGSRGLLGSRSTFSAWGAFLGDAPMLVQPGGDAYRPHARVYESDPAGVDSFAGEIAAE